MMRLRRGGWGVRLLAMPTAHTNRFLETALAHIANFVRTDRHQDAISHETLGASFLFGGTVEFKGHSTKSAAQGCIYTPT